MKRLLWVASFVVAIGIFLFARDIASWRPQLLEIKRTKSSSFQFSKDGRWLLIQGEGYQDGTLWNWRERRLVRKVAFGSYQFSPDGKFLADAAMSVKKVGADRAFAARVKILDTESGRLVRTFSDPKSRIADGLLDARWTDDGKNLVVATSYGCRIWLSHFPSGERKNYLAVGGQKDFIRSTRHTNFE